MKNKIPAIPYFKALRMFALSKGLRFFTWNEQLNAMDLYKSFAERNN